MSHPLLLHMRAASWSLNAARGALEVRAREEAELIAAEAANVAEDGLRSSSYGQRGGSGGHGDPVAGTALASLPREPRPNRYAQLSATVTDTLRWLADTLNAPEGGDPLTRLDAANLLPGTAATVTRWLDENDRRIRDSINLTPHLWPLPGAPECPRCGLRSLYVQTAAPSHLWTVICRTGCLCAGSPGGNPAGGCPCGMPVRVEGVGHIWDRTAPLVEQALLGAYDTRPPGPITDVALPDDPNACTDPTHPRRMPSGWCPICHDDGTLAAGDALEAAAANARP